MKQHISHCRWDFQVSDSELNACILKLINNSSSQHKETHHREGSLDTRYKLT